MQNVNGDRNENMRMNDEDIGESSLTLCVTDGVTTEMSDVGDDVV